MAEYAGSMVMSMRLFRPEKMPTLENLLTPVSRVNLTCASLALMAEYSPRRASRLARASSGFASASRIGRSYSSTSTAARCPVRSCNMASSRRKRAGPLE